MEPLRRDRIEARNVKKCRRLIIGPWNHRARSALPRPISHTTTARGNSRGRKVSTRLPMPGVMTARPAMKPA